MELTLLPLSQLADQDKSETPPTVEETSQQDSCLHSHAMAPTVLPKDQVELFQFNLANLLSTKMVDQMSSLTLPHAATLTPFNQTMPSSLKLESTTREHVPKDPTSTSNNSHVFDHLFGFKLS